MKCHIIGAQKTSLFEFISFKWLVRIVSIIIFLTGWQILGLRSSSLLVPTPLEVVQGFVSLTTSGQLPTLLAQTLWIFFVGFVVGSLVGVAVGALMARYKTFETIIDPYVNALYATPYVALVPLFFLWLGIGFQSRVFIVILSVVFVVIINTNAGMRDVNKSLVEAGRSFGFFGFPLYQKVVLPATLPYIIAALRLGIARGLIAAIVAELLVQLVGLGYLLEYLGANFFVAEELAVVLVIAIVGLALTESLKYAERRVAKWRISSSGA